MIPPRHYTCVRGYGDVRDHHEPGYVFVTSDVAVAWGCRHCGLVYWSHIDERDPRTGRCQGVTQAGKQCKTKDLPEGERFCLTHKYQGSKV